MSPCSKKDYPRPPHRTSIITENINNTRLRRKNHHLSFRDSYRPLNGWEGMLDKGNFRYNNHYEKRSCLSLKPNPRSIRPTSAIEQRQVLISKIPNYLHDKDKIFEFFSKFGNIESVQFSKKNLTHFNGDEDMDKKNVEDNVAIITFSCISEAQAAYKSSDNILGDKSIEIKLSAPPYVTIDKAQIELKKEIQENMNSLIVKQKEIISKLDDPFLVLSSDERSELLGMLKSIQEIAKPSPLNSDTPTCQSPKSVIVENGTTSTRVISPSSNSIDLRTRTLEIQMPLVSEKSFIVNLFEKYGAISDVQTEDNLIFHVKYSKRYEAENVGIFTFFLTNVD